MLFEAVSPAALLCGLAQAPPAGVPRANQCLAGLWLAHYAHRAFIYPLARRARGRRIPLLVVAAGVLFNTANGWLNGASLALSRPAPAPAFVLGVALWTLALAANLDADYALLALRGRYAIPRGGLFELVSCANHAAELAEWCAFALAAGAHWPPLAFAAWTAFNLVPRARAHHQWYREHFGAAYPPQRTAIIPYLL